MKPNKITVHTTATPFGRNEDVASITRMHRQRGFRTIGYHRLIRLDGVVENGRPLNEQGAHVQGFNRDNIGIVLVGGLGRDGKPASTYSQKMLQSLYNEIVKLCAEFNIAYDQVCGHRDFSPDLNKDGRITSNEFTKECPCFDVRLWLKGMLKTNGVK